MVAVRRWASLLFRVLMTLTALAGVVQIFLAGRGVFGVRGGTSLDHETSVDPHRTLGNIIASRRSSSSCSRS